MYVVTRDNEKSEIIPLTKEKASLAVYFADFNVFITWPKHSPCVAQFL